MSKLDVIADVICPAHLGFFSPLKTFKSRISLVADASGKFSLCLPNFPLQ